MPALFLPEVIFVPPVTVGGSVKFLHFHSVFFVFLSLQLLKLGEIDSVKMLAGKSGSIKFWTNLMSVSYHDKRLQLGFTNKMGQLDIAFKIWRSVNIFHMLFGLEFNFFIV